MGGWGLRTLEDLGPLIAAGAKAVDEEEGGSHVLLLFLLFFLGGEEVGGCVSS